MKRLDQITRHPWTKRWDDSGSTMVDVLAASILRPAPYVLSVSVLQEDRL